MGDSASVPRIGLFNVPFPEFAVFQSPFSLCPVLGPLWTHLDPALARLSGLGLKIVLWQRLEVLGVHSSLNAPVSRLKMGIPPLIPLDW